MHSLLTTIGLRQLLAAEAPALAGSFLMAEAFYKFHSFTLECLAFLATWYALGRLQGLLTGGDRP
jgi:hypothetical protein